MPAPQPALIIPFISDSSPVYFTSAESFVLPVFPFADALISNVHAVAKFRLAFAAYVPFAVSRAVNVGPDIDIDGILEPILTIAPLTGLPVASFTVTVMVSKPFFGGAGLNAAATRNVPCIEASFMLSAAEAANGKAATNAATRANGVTIFMMSFR